MRTILLAGAVLALAACGGGNDTSDEANALTADNMMMDGNLALDPNASIDGNAVLDANASVDANTANLIAKDAVTNDPDTNLANGL